MIRLSQVVENKWSREILLFTLLFVITILNDREGIVNPHELRDGFFIFLILYLHVQFQRFVILPFLMVKRYFVYTFLAVTAIFFFAALAYVLDREMTNVGWYDDDLQNHTKLFLYYLFCFSLSLPILLLIFFIVSFYNQEKIDTAHKILLKDMELSLLRSQLNPHFLFNSLNNLYGISLEKPAEVSEKIMQMSQIMRYQLELSKKKYVSLEEDIKFITDYIAIESDRVSERCEVRFIQENFDKGINQYKIAPLILICFVENAFKHFEAGIKKGFIDIYLGLDGDVLFLILFNSCAVQKINPDSTRVGLLNTKKRLDILYPERYELSYSQQENRYELILRLQLDADTISAD